LEPAVSCAALLAEVDSPSSSEVVFWSAYVAAFHLPTGGGSGRNRKGGPIERLQEVSDILATASSSSPTRVRAALKEFADLRIDLKVLAAQVLLQRVESSYTETPNRGLVSGPVDRKRPRRRAELRG
jgi:hypothetical protein